MATPKIQVLSEGAQRGTSFPLTKESYSLGRAESCDICIPDSTISGHHCTLIQGENGSSYSLRDEGSTNGTRVNGEHVEEGVEVRLNNGDIFQVGGIELLYDSGENTHVEIGRTATVINLDDTGVADRVSTTLHNMGGKTGAKRRVMLRDNRKHKIVFYVIITLLAILALGAVAYFLMNLAG